MRSRLGAIEQDEGPRLVGPTGHVGHGINGAEDVRDVGESHEPGARREQATEGILVEHALAHHGNGLHHRASLPADHLPRDEVRVVLHLRDQDLVAGLEGQGERARHDVDAVGGAAREDDLLTDAGADEDADGISRGLVHLRGLLAQGVNGAMDVGVRLLVVALHRLEDLSGLLAGRGRVEVDEGLAVDDAPQDGKVGPGLLVEGHLATSRPSRAPCSTESGSVTHFMRVGRMSASSRSSKVERGTEAASSTAFPRTSSTRRSGSPKIPLTCAL